ncbi:MAG: ATP-binding protein [Bacillota bacterium]
MQDFEKLGAFHLGREFDRETQRPTEELLLYDAKDLVTHAVVIGMTGSGKTGLSISLLEEAAIDGVPAIIIDPKGDMGNLLLTFPDLRGPDFAPWVSEAEAARKGLSVEAYAEAQAQLWREGLARWGQDGERIRRLRASAEFAIYTPGSTAGLPVSILASFAAPPPSVLEDPELLGDRVQTVVSSLLGLLQIPADPLRSREHIFLAHLVEHNWRVGQSLDLASLIAQIQAPPLERVGVMDLETFYPARERFALAMQLNGLVASPGFQMWLQGESLEIDRILYTAQGKPRISIFSIAHLDDAERMFFVSLLLNQVVSWMRAQRGTPSLRALLYMDEVFGYLPPNGNPPSKRPLMILLKQARAIGLGVMLATQNPVDLDYKALSNAGTWFLGRLQTERDKARVLDGLEGASGAGGFDRGEMERLLSALGSRVFLMHNVHEEGPVLFSTRWAMSYLPGPLTREQIRSLAVPAQAPVAAAAASPAVAESRPAVPGMTGQRPALPPEIPQFYLEVRSREVDGERLVYQPMVYGYAAVHLKEAKLKITATEASGWMTPVLDQPIPVDWARGAATPLQPEELSEQPEPGGLFAPPPGQAVRAKAVSGWSRALADELYRNYHLSLLQSREFGLVSQPGESEREFRIRLRDEARTRRDELVDGLRRKYAPRLASLEERLRRAEERHQREQAERLESAVSFGASLLGALLGGGRRRRGSTAALRGLGRSVKQSQDVGRAAESVEAVRQQLADLEAELQQEIQQAEWLADTTAAPLEILLVRPRKADIDVRFACLLWAPHWLGPDGQLRPAW